MSQMNPTLLAAIVSICLTGLSAKADLLQLDSPHFGASSLTLDTRTGLTWLDLPFSVNLSYLQAEAATQPGGQFAGFRHATAQEVLSLYNSAGFGTGFIPQSSSSYQNVASLLSLVGGTSIQDGVTEAAGLTGTVIGDGSASGSLDYMLWDGVPGYMVSGGTALVYGLNFSAPTVGNWLVVVPEPSAGALLVAPAALAVVLRRRKSKARSSTKA